MGGLINAIAELLAAALGKLGYLGRPRRRKEIRDDLALLSEMEAFGDRFGPGTTPHSRLAAAIETQIDALSEISAPTKRNWGSFVLAVTIGAPSAYVTYQLNENGFDIWSVPLGILAFVMLLGAWAMVFPSDSDEDDSSSEG